MTTWIITRESRRGLAYRNAQLHLTDERGEARVYTSLDQATADANDGDVVVPREGPVTRPMLDVDAILRDWGTA